METRRVSEGEAGSLEDENVIQQNTIQVSDSVPIAPGIAASRSSRVASPSLVKGDEKPVAPYVNLADYTRARFNDSTHPRLEIRSQQVPEPYSRRLGGNGRFELTAESWQLHAAGMHLATARMVVIKGAKTEILNTWIFPNYPDSTPIFAAELIAVGGAPRLAFIDIQAIRDQPPILAEREGDTQFMNLAQTRGADLSATLRSKFSRFNSPETPPAWAVDASVGNYFFLRGGSTADFNLIQSCYRAYFETYCASNLLPIMIHLSREDALDRLLNYQRHHMRHSPGTRFLGNLFGVDWTTEFLTDFLYTTP